MSDLPAMVTVVYALPDHCRLVEVPYAPGLTALAACERSGLLEVAGSTIPSPPVLGLYGRPVRLDAPLEPGDRIEICRPLVNDPRAARMALSREGRVIGARSHEGTADVAAAAASAKDAGEGGA